MLTLHPLAAFRTPTFAQRQENPTISSNLPFYRIQGLLLSLSSPTEKRENVNDLIRALEAGEIFSTGRFVKGSPSDVDVCSGDSDDADKQPEQPARENVHTHKNSVTCRPNGELACP